MAVTNQGTVLVLDSLFDDIDVERDAAASLGWDVVRWDGSDGALSSARVAVHVRTRIDETLLSRMPVCRVVGRFGSGIDTVDTGAASRRGVSVVRIRDYCTPELTAHTLALAFTLERQVQRALELRLAPTSTWDEIGSALPIAGRTCAAVVGFGTIGSAMTRALLGMGMTVSVVTAHGGVEAERLGARSVDLSSALRAAELVFLHVALTPETERLIDRGRLATMRSDALLIDTARLGLIDEAAVAEALAASRLAGVALDARLAEDSPLSRLRGDPQLLVTPHVGWYSARSAGDLRRRTMVDSIRAMDAGAEMDERPRAPATATAVGEGGKYGG
jgi:D-3-phosphoglycerate dehydrogenase / 2-oxoglutarate reductase